MTENVWPKCDVAITGESLHAPLIERLFELPMDIYGGRCDGELQILMRDEDDWNVFPQFGGRIMVRDGAFHFWDAPDDFSGTEMDLRFEGETCHLVGGRGHFGAVPLRASGRLGMNPETGQYDLRAEIPPADVNAVRATLGARPLPYPVAGAVQGHLTCYGALETPIFSGRVRSAREGRWLGGGGGGGEVSDAEEALRAAREAGHEADLALDKVALQDAEALFTFTAASAELRVPAAEARPLGGGRLRGAAAIAVDPAAEHDPRALQAEFSGRGLDPALARAYAPTLQNAAVVRDTVGRVSVRGSAVGSHAAPVIRAAVEAPHCGSQAVVVLRRESAACSLRAPALLVSGTVLTEFPPFEEQKRALTQADATAMAQPHVTGARGLLDVRGLDLQPLMQALEDPAAPPGAADAATAPAAGPPDPATGLPAPMPARLRGQLKLWMNERGSDGAADSSGVGDGSAAGGRGVSYDGSMELQGLRVNQMQLAHGLKGDFSVDDGRFQLDADGFWAYEKLRVDLNFAGLGMLERLASLEGLLGEGGLEGSGGRVAEGPANEMLLGPRRARAGGSLLELQHGNMKVSASVDGAMEQVEVKADGLPLEKLNIGGVKGTLRNVDIAANLRTRAASASLDVIKPHLQGAQAENLHAEAELDDGLLTLRNTRLKQAASTYDVDGEYRLWAPAPPTPATAAGPAPAVCTTPSAAPPPPPRQPAAAPAGAAAGGGVRNGAKWDLIGATRPPDAVSGAADTAAARGGPAGDAHLRAWEHTTAADAGASTAGTTSADAPADGAPVFAGGSQRAAHASMLSEENALQGEASVGVAEAGVTFGELRGGDPTAAAPGGEDGEGGATASAQIDGDSEHGAIEHEEDAATEVMDADGDGAVLGGAGDAEGGPAAKDDTVGGYEPEAAEGVEQPLATATMTAAGHAPPQVDMAGQRGLVSASAAEGDVAARTAAVADAGADQSGAAIVTDLLPEGGPSGEGVAAATEAAWWLRVRADAQLQDIVPTVETLRRRSTRPAPATAAPQGVGLGGRGRGVDDVLGIQTVQSEEDAGRGGFAGEFAARADSIRAEFARMVDAASLADADGVGPLEAAEVTLAKRVAEATWFVGDSRGPGPAAAGAADAVRLPGLSSVTGRVKGELEARGGGMGASSVRMGVQGAEWRWGPVLLDEVLVDAALDEHQGLKIEQLDVKSNDGATMLMKGSLLGEAQDAVLSIDKFPLATLDPLVRAALPSLHTPPHSPPAPLGPLAKPLSALQGYAYRAADALSLPYSGSREPGSARGAGAGSAAGNAATAAAPIRGLLHASGTLSGSAEQPAAALSARVDAASLGAVPLSTAAASATLDPAGHMNVSAEIVPAAAPGSLVLAAEASVPDGTGLDATLTIRDAGLAVLTELTGAAGPKWREGSADVRVHMRGTVAAPTMSGSATVSRARLDMPHLREPLTGVAGALAVEGDVLKVKDLKGSAGEEGRLTAKGRLPLTPRAAREDPRARLDMSAQAIEVKHPALLGSVDASVAATGSAAAPALAGELRISRGAIIASGTFAPTGAAAPGAAAAAGPAKPDSAGSTDPAPPGGRAELLRTLHSFKTRGSRATGGDSDPAAVAAEVAAAAATSEDGLDNVSLQEFRVLLGPDLRVTWFPFLQVSLASPGVVLTGPAVPASLRIAGEVELGPGNVNVFATQFSIDRNRRNAVIFHGEEPGAEPVVDVAMASREFRFAVAAPLRDAPRAITITRLADGATQAVAADAPEMLAAQLRALLLEDDGRLAVQSMLANAVSAVLPRIEGSGRLGNAHWRLVGAPTPLLGNEAAGMFLGAQAEAEMSWGARWKVLLSSRHLADAQLSTSYQLAPGVRLYGGYRAPRSALTLMLDFGDRSSGLFGR